MAKWLRKWRRGWLYVRSNTKNAKSLILEFKLPHYKNNTLTWNLFSLAVSVVRTLSYHAESIVTDPTDKETEIAHVKYALRNFSYTDWTFFMVNWRDKISFLDQKHLVHQIRFCHHTLYWRTLGIIMSGIQNSRGFHNLQPANMLRRALVAPKDKTEQSKQSGIVCEITSSDCDAVYIGESARKLEKRLSEHKSTAGSSKSAIREHVIRSKGHQIDWESVKVLELEPKGFSRRILEAIRIRTLKPKLNCDKGLDLDPNWDNLLMPQHHNIFMTSFSYDVIPDEDTVCRQYHSTTICWRCWSGKQRRSIVE